MPFEGTIINQIKTVIKYVLIQFRDINNNLIKTLRLTKKDTITPPDYNTSIISIGDNNRYSFFQNWKDQNGNRLTTTVPNEFTTYTPEVINVVCPKEVTMQCVGPYTSNQSMLTDCILESSMDLYIKNTSISNYIIIPTCVYNYVNGVKRTTVSFIVQNYSYIPGLSTTIEPTFTLYTNSACTDKLGDIKIKITIHSSGQSTGD